MEYRRKRKTTARRGTSFRTASGRSNSRTSNETGRAIISLLMVGAIVYLISASAAGTWIAENVMAPLISAFSKAPDGPGDSQTVVNTPPLDDDNTSVDLSGSDTNAITVSAQVSLPSVDCFMLQMGVYASEDNARKQAESLQAQGAGGYILEDTSTGEIRYRVMASGYSSAESAKSVKERLVSEGIDCTVYELSAAAATFRVTAAQDRIPGIETGFAALEKAQGALCAASIDFDKNSMSVEDGKALVHSVLSTLQNDMNTLIPFEGSSAMLSQLLAAYRETAAELQALSDGAYESTVAFSAQLKHTQLFAAHRYARLMSGLV